MPENTPPSRDTPIGSETPAAIVWPLTSDVFDTNGGNAFTGPGTAYITPDGFAANGNDARLQVAAPAWAAPARGNLHMFLRARHPGPAAHWRELVASVIAPGNDPPKIELAMVDDPTHVPSTALGLWVLRCSSGTMTPTIANGGVKPLCRAEWRFEFRWPEMQPGSTTIPLPQALCFLDANTLLLAGYASSSYSVLHRVDLTTGEFTGRAKSTTYQHINGLHVDPDGGVWCVCRVGGFDKRKRLDLTASFASGEITESGDWNTGDVPTSSISFATVGGVEYALLSQYATAGSPKCYVFLRSQMSGTVNQSDRVKRFNIGLRVQDLVQRASDGLLYLSRNGSSGGVQAYDLAAILAGPDDSTPAPVFVHSAATAWAEGIDFHPTTDRLWMCTEGYGTSTADLWSHCAVWSSALAGAEWNSFLIDWYRGEMNVSLNGRLQHRFTYNNAALADAYQVAIGGAPFAPPVGGYMSTGNVRNFALSSVPFTLAELAALESP